MSNEEEDPALAMAADHERAKAKPWLGVPVPSPPPADLYTYHVSDPNRISPFPMALFDRQAEGPDLFVTLCTHHAKIWRARGIIAAWTASPARRPKCILCPAAASAAIVASSVHETDCAKATDHAKACTCLLAVNYDLSDEILADLHADAVAGSRRGLANVTIRQLVAMARRSGPYREVFAALSVAALNPSADWGSSASAAAHDYARRLVPDEDLRERDGSPAPVANVRDALYITFQAGAAWERGQIPTPITRPLYSSEPGAPLFTAAEKSAYEKFLSSALAFARCFARTGVMSGDAWANLMQFARAYEDARRVAAKEAVDEDIVRARQEATELAARKPSKPDAILVERGEWRRASGLTTCHVCSLLFADHGRVLGYEWLTRICDGRLVKL